MGVLGVRPPAAGKGRPKGAKNKTSRTVVEILARLNVDPVEGMARIAKGDVECGACHGAGKTMYQPARGQQKLAERTCESCYGSGKERITPELRGRMLESLAKYRYPQLKQIEHSGPGGDPIPHAVTIEFVKSKNAT